MVYLLRVEVSSLLTVKTWINGLQKIAAESVAIFFVGTSFFLFRQ